MCIQSAVITSLLFGHLLASGQLHLSLDQNWSRTERLPPTEESPGKIARQCDETLFQNSFCI